MDVAVAAAGVERLAGSEALVTDFLVWSLVWRISCTLLYSLCRRHGEGDGRWVRWSTGFDRSGMSSSSSEIGAELRRSLKLVLGD